MTALVKFNLRITDRDQGFNVPSTTVTFGAVTFIFNKVTGFQETPEIALGLQRLTISNPGYTTFSADFNVLASMAGQNIGFQLSRTTTAPVIPAPGPGKVEGIITLEGRPDPRPEILVVAGDRSARADVSGFYSLELPAGTYAWEARALGYDTKRFPNITVTASRTTRIDQTLTRAAVVIPPAPITEDTSTLQAEISRLSALVTSKDLVITGLRSTVETLTIGNESDRGDLLALEQQTRELTAQIQVLERDLEAQRAAPKKQEVGFQWPEIGIPGLDFDVILGGLKDFIGGIAGAINAEAIVGTLTAQLNPGADLLKRINTPASVKELKVAVDEAGQIRVIGNALAAGITAASTAAEAISIFSYLGLAQNVLAIPEIAHQVGVARSILDIDTDTALLIPYRRAQLKKWTPNIPGAGDIIRMSVREFFTPDIARRFGQFDEFPEDFARWYEEQGFSRFWAEGQWVSHWSLPSTNQGFEMFHRLTPDLIERQGEAIRKIGIDPAQIKTDIATLRLLMKANDITPFWRERLIAISYNPLTRVDIRRFNRVGLLDERGLIDRYRMVGFSPGDAELMAKFTILFNQRDGRDLTKTEILRGFRTKQVTAARARDFLSELGYELDEIDFLLDLNDAQEKGAIRELSKSVAAAAYRSGLRDRNWFEDRLRKIGFTQEARVVILEIEELKALSEPKMITLKQLAVAFRQDLVNAEFVDLRLKAMRYEEPDLSILKALMFKKEVEPSDVSAA